MDEGRKSIISPAAVRMELANKTNLKKFYKNYRNKKRVSILTVQPFEKTELSLLRANEDSIYLNHQHYEYWYNVLISDNAVKLKKILDSANQQEQNKLLNGVFLYDRPANSHQIIDVSERHACQKETSKFARPLTLSAIFLAFQNMKILLQQQVVIEKLDDGRNNVIHAVIWAANLHPGKEVEYVTMIELILSKQTPEKKRRLLFQENDKGTRPLELAAVQGCWMIVDYLLKVNDVYRFPQWRNGMHEYVLYDITDYETGSSNSRSNKSPLRCLLNVSRETIGSLGVARVCESPIMRAWARSIYDRNVLSMALLFFCTCVYIYYYSLMSGDIFESFHLDFDAVINFEKTAAAENRTPEEHYNFLKTINVVVADEYVGKIGDPNATCQLENGVTEFLRQRNQINNPKVVCLVFSIYILMISFYRSVVWMYETFIDFHYFGLKYHYIQGKHVIIRNDKFSMTLVLQAIAYIFLYAIMKNRDIWMGPLGNTLEIIASVLYGSILFFSFWNLLYFIQSLKAIGHFVIIFQNIMDDLIKFFILYFVVQFSFSHAFYSIRTIRLNCIDSPNMNITYFENMYDLFLLSLNIGSKEFASRVYSSNVLISVKILHITYVFVAVILLVNFLIAVMTHSVTLISENKHMVKFLNRLDMALSLDTTLAHVIAAKLLPKIYYKSYLHSKGRMYLQCAEAIVIANDRTKRCID